MVNLLKLGKTLVLMLMLCSVTWAADWYVRTDGNDSNDGDSWAEAFETISHAISEASSGDTITVRAGTYTENINFNGKNIELVNEDIDDWSVDDWSVVEALVIDGSNGSNSTVLFTGDETSSCVLSGFTITGGTGWQAGDNSLNGGGISCSGGDTNNTHATITKCIITGNQATYGGGVAFFSGAMEDCIISKNIAARGGGGIAYCGDVWQCTEPEILRCIIRNNIVNDNNYPGGGGGLTHVHGLLLSCQITGNWIRFAGGGINRPYGAIRNCTIAGNSAYGAYLNGEFQTDGTGGGIYCGYADIDNCIIWGNVSGEFADEGQLRYCENATVAYSCIQDGYAAGSNIMVSDPCFVNSFDFADYTPSANNNLNKINVYVGSWHAEDDVIEYDDDGVVRTITDVTDNTITFTPALSSASEANKIVHNWGPGVTDVDEDWHLLSTSPCVDEGDDTDVGGNEEDIDGEDRIMGETVDMGADEVDWPCDDTCLQLLGDADGDGKVEFNESGAGSDDYVKWDSVYSTGGYDACCDFNQDGVVDYDDYDIGLENHCEEGLACEACQD